MVPKIDTISAFFSKLGNFFLFSKKTAEPLPLVALQDMIKSLQCYFRCENYFATSLYFHITFEETWYLLKMGKHIWEVQRKFPFGKNILLSILRIQNEVFVIDFKMVKMPLLSYAFPTPVHVFITSWKYAQQII